MKKRMIIPILFLIIAVAVTIIVSRRYTSAESTNPTPDSSISEMSEQDTSKQNTAVSETATPETTTSGYEQEEPPQEAAIPETDVQKQPLEIRAYQPNGILLGRHVYTYDDQGNMLSENIYYMGSEEPSYTRIYTYDEQGRKLTYQYSSKHYSSLTEYVYNEQGVQTEALNYNDKNVLSSRTAYTYDEQGNVIKEQCYDNDGNTSHRINCEYTYNEQGKVLTKKETGSWGDKLFEYTYDEQGRLSTETWNLGENGFIKYFEYNYDEQGILFEKKQSTNVSDMGGPLTYDGLFEYVYE